jgi:hypothetical protein
MGVVTNDGGRQRLDDIRQTSARKPTRHGGNRWRGEDDIANLPQPDEENSH